MSNYFFYLSLFHIATFEESAIVLATCHPLTLSVGPRVSTRLVRHFHSHCHSLVSEGAYVDPPQDLQLDPADLPEFMTVCDLIQPMMSGRSRTQVCP